jgi:predicted nucleotidyltransferase
MIKHGIELDSEAIRAFCRKWKIDGMSIFGSIVGDDFGPDSDVDFLVDFNERARWDISDIVDMHHELGGILGRKVDIVSRGALLETYNWVFRKRVLSELEPVNAAR